MFTAKTYTFQRRSFACSFIFGGSGLGGAGFPLLANALLQRLGFRWTLRAMGALVGILGGMALIGAKPRLPVARRATPAPLSLSFITSPVFIFVVSRTASLQCKRGDHTATGNHSLRAGTLLLARFSLHPLVRRLAWVLELERYTCAGCFQPRNRLWSSAIRILLRQRFIHDSHARFLGPFSNLRIHPLGIRTLTGAVLLVRSAIRRYCMYLCIFADRRC